MGSEAESVGTTLLSLLARAELAIGKMGFLHEAHVLLAKGKTAELAWRLQDGKWSLSITEGPALDQQPIARRMAAVRALPALFRELRRKQVEWLDSVNEVIRWGQVFVDELEERAKGEKDA